MKKIIKLVIVLGLILTFACACGNNDVVGSWRREYYHSDSTFVQYYTFYEDGNYVYVTLKDSQCHSYGQGHYEDELFKAVLYEDGEPGWMDFKKIDSNNLMNGESTYVRYEGAIPSCK